MLISFQPIFLSSVADESYLAVRASCRMYPSRLPCHPIFSSMDSRTPSHSYLCYLTSFFCPFTSLTFPFLFSIFFLVALYPVEVNNRRLLDSSSNFIGYASGRTYTFLQSKASLWLYYVRKRNFFVHRGILTSHRRRQIGCKVYIICVYSACLCLFWGTISFIVSNFVTYRLANTRLRLH